MWAARRDVASRVGYTRPPERVWRNAWTPGCLVADARRDRVSATSSPGAPTLDQTRRLPAQGVARTRAGAHRPNRPSIRTHWRRWHFTPSRPAISDAVLRYGIAAAPSEPPDWGRTGRRPSCTRWRCATPTPSPVEQKVVWLERHALDQLPRAASLQACVRSLSRRDRAAPARWGTAWARATTCAGWPSRVLSRSAGGQRRPAAQRGRRCGCWNDAGPNPAAGVVAGPTWPELSAVGLRPGTAADYAARAIALGSALDLRRRRCGVARLRGYAALVDGGSRSGAGWDELEAGWREANGPPQGWPNSPGIVGDGACAGWRRCATSVERGEGYVAETSAYLRGP